MNRAAAMALMVAAPLLTGANTYNANSTHTITSILTYSTNRIILFSGSNMPNVAGCNNTYFVIPPEGDEVARSLVYSRLLTAYASKEPVNIGYDNKSCGYDGYIMAYRIG